MLGEAHSKCQHISGVPLLPGIAEHLHQVYLAKGVLATTAIEGNTLTEEQVMRRLQGKLTLPPSKEYLGQEVDNVIEACNQIAQKIFGGHPTQLTVEEIIAFNQLVLSKLPLAEDVIPGQIRTYPVGVGHYRGAPAEDCKYLLEKLVEWLNQEFAPPNNAYPIAFGVLKAILAHLYLAWIHPFGDGNGRTARLVEFQILLASGVPSAAAQLLSNHYNQTRTEYYRQLDMASKSGGNIVPFIEYALQGFIDGLKEQLELIRGQQLHVHWVNYVHEIFRDKDNPTDIRRRRLVLDLTSKLTPVPKAEIRHVSPRIAEAYSGKLDKTVQRDLNELQKMDLIKKTPEGFVIRRELMSAFLPGTRIDED
ncbi:MAG: Fic family protein [Caldilineaceae bacterium]